MKQEEAMDLYLEFRKMVKPFTIPQGEEEQAKSERFSSRGKKNGEEDSSREDRKDGTIHSMTACEA
jgi:hypothetical protein